MATKRLKRGDEVTTSRGLWAVIAENGELANVQFPPAIYTTRAKAVYECMRDEGERVIRIRGVSGIVA